MRTAYTAEQETPVRGGSRAASARSSAWSAHLTIKHRTTLQNAGTLHAHLPHVRAHARVHLLRCCGRVEARREDGGETAHGTGYRAAMWLSGPSTNQSAWRRERGREAAISMYHRTDWYGRTLEVREDRYAGLSGPGGFRGGARGGLRGLSGRGGGLHGLRGGGFHGGGGYAGASGRDFSNQDLYADYSGPDQGGVGAAYGGGGGGFGAHGGGGGGFGGHGGGGHGGLAVGGTEYVEPEPSQQIMVRNLPWSTANEDLVELFETTGQVELAEILFDGARSKGCGVVQFAQVGEAETAIGALGFLVLVRLPRRVRALDLYSTTVTCVAT
ncbi:hypothetical protein DFH09DRAFT_1466745 [Mycena vulgaris]|nr:hypothetical protein DFH09DRAFT_1466745 [Mycena vulgaris]